MGKSATQTRGGFPGRSVGRGRSQSGLSGCGLPGSAARAGARLQAQAFGRRAGPRLDAVGAAAEDSPAEVRQVASPPFCNNAHIASV